MSKQKEKKIVFSEEVDSSINGFALGISFVLLALFVIYFGIFQNTIAERIVAIVLLVIGIAGTMTEIGRIKKGDIKGVDDLFVGLLFTVAPIIAILKYENVYLNVILFIALMLGSYGTMRGFFEIVYSLKLQKRKSGSVKIEVMKIIVAVTELIALVVAVIQLIQEIS